MENVIDKLKQYNQKVDLGERYTEDVPIEGKDIFNSDCEYLESIKNIYERNVALKGLLCEKYKTANADEIALIDFWIINDWGGIKAFKRNNKNIEKLEKFRKELENQKLTVASFDTISSLSKVASFMKPSDFVIYDSRVIYTLNWLILSCENKDGFKEKYYRMPSGRNKKISTYDLNTIIKIAHLSKNLKESDLFFSKQEAYFKYCSFVKEHTKSVCGDNAKPYQLEMLLFTLADKEILKELKDKVKISF